MPRTALGLNVESVSVGKQHQLGFEYEDHDPENPDRGVRVFRYIQNGDVSSILAGMVVQRQSGSNGQAIGEIAGDGTATAAEVLGVAQWVIPTGYYGFVQCRGYADVETDGTVTANSDVVPGIVGSIGNFSAGDEHRVIGVALETDIGSGNTVPCILNLP